MIAGRALLILLSWLLTLTAAAPAQERGASTGPPERVSRAFTLEHQSAAEAVNLVYPYLSEHGTVELRPGGNTLLVRDRAEVIARLEPLLRDFDHPARPLQLEIQIVSAGGAAVGEEESPRLSAELEARLQQLLRYKSYRLMATVRLEAAEGRIVASPLGPEYEVDFRLGTVGADRRIKLHGFRVLRRQDGSEAKALIHTNLNLWLDRPMVLGLARTESSDNALMVVLSCRRSSAGDRDGESPAPAPTSDQVPQR